MIGMLLGPALAAVPAWPDLSEAPRAGGGRADAAVIVAVEDYAVVSDIPGAQANAVDWYTYFTDGRGIPASRVKLLVNQEGVRESITDAVAQARAAVRPGGTLWFVFIGHGAPGRDGADGLLVGWDTQQTASSLYARGVSQAELVSAMAGGAQAETVLVLDACFSGQGSGAGGTLVSGLQPMIPTSAVPTGAATVLSAGQSNEFAGPLPGLDRPAFSYLVLGALRGWGDADKDGAVSAREAADYSTAALAALPIGRSQTPQLVAPDPALLLGAGQEAGPDLAAIRKSLLGTTSASGSGDLASQLAQLQQMQAGESARQQAADQLGDVVRGEARTLWVQVEALAEQGDEAGLLALQAFVAQYRAATVEVDGQSYPVQIPEVARATQWIQTYGAGQAARTASAYGLRTDGYYRCEPPIYGGASSELVSLVVSEELNGAAYLGWGDNGLERKYPSLREKADAGRGVPFEPQEDGTLRYFGAGTAEVFIQEARPDAIDVSWAWLGINKVHGGAPNAISCAFVPQ